MAACVSALYARSVLTLGEACCGERSLAGGGSLLVSAYACDVKVFSFWPKAMDYSKALSPISLLTHNSSLEGATELKFAPFCSP